MSQLFETEIALASDGERVAFARAMAAAASWSAERAIDFFDAPTLWGREFEAWSRLGRPGPAEPAWNRFLELALSAPRLREFLWDERA